MTHEEIQRLQRLQESCCQIDVKIKDSGVQSRLKEPLEDLIYVLHETLKLLRKIAEREYKQ